MVGLEGQHNFSNSQNVYTALFYGESDVHFISGLDDSIQICNPVGVILMLSKYHYRSNKGKEIGQQLLFFVDMERQNVSLQ